jgi:hypothetical protein
MIAPLAKLLDWSAVQAATLMLLANVYRNNPRLEEALEFLKSLKEIRRSHSSSPVFRPE